MIIKFINNLSIWRLKEHLVFLSLINCFEPIQQLIQWKDNYICERKHTLGVSVGFGSETSSSAKVSLALTLAAASSSSLFATAADDCSVVFGYGLMFSLSLSQSPLFRSSKPLFGFRTVGLWFPRTAFEGSFWGTGFSSDLLRFSMTSSSSSESSRILRCVF